MIYRVFLQDEKDAPGGKNVHYTFRIRSGSMLAWYTDCPSGYVPSLETQLRAMNHGFTIGPSEKPLDGHWLILKAGHHPLGIVHTQEEIEECAYDLARTEATNLAAALSAKDGKQHIFIDLTRISLAIHNGFSNDLVRIVQREEIPDFSPRTVDIGD